MKKFIILFFLGFALKSIGQTYTLRVGFSSSSGPSSGGSYSASFSGNGGLFDSRSGLNISASTLYPAVSLSNTSFGLSISTNTGGFIGCNIVNSTTITAANLLVAGYSSLGGCNGSVSLNNFAPNNVTIQNLNASTTICAGEQLGLAAFPAGFPAEAYHWQYSYDQVTWIDVPIKQVNGLDINNTKTSNFTIYDILGLDHVNHFGDIYFRVGYSGRPFSTNTIKINYSPCAPIVTNVIYEGPKCNGDGIQKLDILFDRSLDSTKGESLFQLYVRETVNNIPPIKTTPLMLVSDVTYPSSTSIYSYSNFSTYSSLEKGREYEIIYQAQVNNPFDVTKKILKGIFVSAKKFTFNEPEKLIFTATPIQPFCSYDTGGVAITASGGTPPYSYILDGGAPIEFTSPYNLTRLSPVNHTIKVIDSKNCIEKIP
jgi:hypothetical protein